MLRRYHEPAGRVDATVTRHFGVDMEAIAKMEMRQWYLNLLDTGEPRFLAPGDYSLDVNLSTMADGSLEITLPVGTRRVMEVQLSCWSRPATICLSPDETLLRRLANPFSRPGQTMPVAIVNSNKLKLYSLPQGQASTRVTRLSLVVDTGADCYRMDESALSLIKPIN